VTLSVQCIIKVVATRSFWLVRYLSFDVLADSCL